MPAHTKCKHNLAHVPACIFEHFCTELCVGSLGKITKAPCSLFWILKMTERDSRSVVVVWRAVTMTLSQPEMKLQSETLDDLQCLYPELIPVQHKASFAKECHVKQRVFEIIIAEGAI